MDNRSSLSLPADHPTQLCDRAPSHTFMTSYDYTSFSSAPNAAPFTHSQVVYENFIYIFVLHMHGLLLSPTERKRLSYKNTTREIIDLHLFIWDEAEPPPCCQPRGLCVRIPEVSSHPSVLFFFMPALNRGHGLQSVSALP